MTASWPRRRVERGQLRTSEAEVSIGKIIDSAIRVEERIEGSAAGDTDLQELASAVVEAGHRARERVRKQKSPFSLPRIRLYVILLALGVLVVWLYLSYFQRKEVRIAVTALGSSVLRSQIEQGAFSDVVLVDSQGSSDHIERVLRGEADMAVVQGGLSIPRNFSVIAPGRREYVLFFTREPLGQREPLPVITFSEGQGSETLGGLFFRHWGFDEIEWIHSWGNIAIDENYEIPPGAQAVFVVVDPSDPAMRSAIRRVALAGFRLQDADLGVLAERLDYLNVVRVPRGYFHLSDPAIPQGGDRALQTYTVDTFLVAGPSLTYRQRATAASALQQDSARVGLLGKLLHSGGSSVMEDLSIFLGTVVNLAVIMAALFGVEILLHRRYLVELNSLISRISLRQSDRGFLGITESDTLKANRFVLESYSDLLGLVSSICGYYTQENAALMFSGLSGPIHGRANTLKINIQLKLLHLGNRLETASRPDD